MSWLRYSLAPLLGAMALFAAGQARAATDCSVKTTDLEFGTADNATATITYHCSSDALLLFVGRTVEIRMCLAIGAGEAGTVADRRMTTTEDDELPFGIFKEPSHTSPWGNVAPLYREVVINYWLPPGLFPRAEKSGDVTVYGRVPSRSGLAAGQYSSFFADASMRYRYSEGGPRPGSCAGGDTEPLSFTARAMVLGSCSVVTASDMNFSPGGMPLSGTSTGNLTSNSTIDLTCTNRTAWQVGLDDGMNASGGSRQMCNPGGACIAYQLTQPGSTVPWGNDLDTNTVKGISTGTQQTLTVNGRVNDQPLTQAGRYSDTVKVTLTY